ncbi:MAG: hypothetical protein GY749_42060 [Desulfobacteraceae bacterium]|nr:hypothetical protein [Desulfobacteraceae bacterium]
MLKVRKDCVVDKCGRILAFLKSGAAYIVDTDDNNIWKDLELRECIEKLTGYPIKRISSAPEVKKDFETMKQERLKNRIRTLVSH